MGPVEKALREARVCRSPFATAAEFAAAYWVARGAAENLTGWSLSMVDAFEEGILPDVLSEAIEAAEALNL